MKKLILTIDRGTSSEELKRNLIKVISEKYNSIKKVKDLKKSIPPITQEQKSKLKTLKPTINILKIEGKNSKYITQVKKDDTIINLDPNSEYEIRTQYIPKKDLELKWAYKIGNEKKSNINQYSIRIKTPNDIISKEDQNYILVSLFKNNRFSEQTRVLITCTDIFIEEPEEIKLNNPTIMVHDLSGKKPIQIISTNKDQKITLNINKRYRITTYGIGGEGIITWTQNIDSTKPKELHGEGINLIPNIITPKGEIKCTIEKGEITEGITTLKIMLTNLPPHLPN